MEGSRFSFHQLTLTVEGWNILSRIAEKAPLWNISLSKRRLHSIPEIFLTHAFLYYILKYHPRLLRDYSQQQLMAVSLALKKTYSINCSQFFKSTNNFNITFVLLPKVLQYFLCSHFPAQFPSNIEASIFGCIIEGVLGYTVDSNAYSILQKRVQGKRAHKQRETLEIVEAEVLPLFQQPTRSQKRLHRRAQFDVFSSVDAELKPLNEFKKQIHQALYVKRALPSRKEPFNNKILSEVVTPKSGSEWNKNKYLRLNLHQISSAMALQPGFDIQRGSAAIHISKKRQIRQTCIPCDYQCQRDSIVTPIASGATPSASRSKSWSKIIQEMRDSSKQNKPCPMSKAPPVIPHSVSSLHLGPRFAKKKGKLELQMMPVSFINQKPEGGMCVQLRECQESPGLLGGRGVNLAKNLDAFEKKCLQRRRRIQKAYDITS